MLYGEHAKCQAEAEYPEIWTGRVGAWSPCLSPPGGTVLRDLSGRGNHGTLTNMDPATDWVLSGGTAALDFDGSNDDVRCGNAANLQLSIGTLSLWFRTSNTVNNFFAMCAKTLAYNLFLWNSKLTLYDWGGGAPRDVAGSVSDGKWHHAAVTFGGGSAVVYLDGSVVLSPSFSVSSQANQVIIGSSNGVQYWSGLLTDVLINARQRTVSEMRLLYRLGPGGWATPRRRRWNYVAASQLTNRRRRLLFSAR